MKRTSSKRINLNGARSLLIPVLCSVVIAGATLAQAASSSATRKRCAFDIGSGETKVLAAEVLSAEPTAGVTRLLAKKILISFAGRLKDGAIPDWLVEEAVAKLNGLKKECEALGAREFSGVATSGFRMARNAQAALARISEKTKIPMRVITGDQEAVLGFLAAASALRLNGENLVVWDIGGGSLQFSMSAASFDAVRQEYIVSSGHRGSELFRRAIAKQLGRATAKPVNPLSQDEMIRAIALAKEWSRGVNPKIVERLRRGDMRVVGLGGIHTESLTAQAGLQGTAPYEAYTLDRVRAAAKRAVNMTDQDFRKTYPANNYPAHQATNVALVLGYMEGLRITNVIPIQVTLADGLLVDAKYWPNAKVE